MLSNNDPRLVMMVKRIEEIEKSCGDEIKSFLISEDILRPMGGGLESNFFCMKLVGQILSKRDGWFKKRNVNKFNNKRYFVYVGKNSNSTEMYNI